MAARIPASLSRRRPAQRLMQPPGLGMPLSRRPRQPIDRRPAVDRPAHAFGQHHAQQKLGIGQPLARCRRHPIACFNLIRRCAMPGCQAMREIELRLRHAGLSGPPVPGHGSGRVARISADTVIVSRAEIELRPGLTGLGTCLQTPLWLGIRRFSHRPTHPAQQP